MFTFPREIHMLQSNLACDIIWSWGSLGGDYVMKADSPLDRTVSL